MQAPPEAVLSGGRSFASERIYTTSSPSGNMSSSSSSASMASSSCCTSASMPASSTAAAKSEATSGALSRETTCSQRQEQSKPAGKRASCLHVCMGLGYHLALIGRDIHVRHWASAPPPLSGQANGVLRGACRLQILRVTSSQVLGAIRAVSFHAQSGHGASQLHQGILIGNGRERLGPIW